MPLRNSRLLLFLLVSAVALHAAQLKISVLDPDSAPVAGAEVTLFQKASSRVVAVATTSGQGGAEFRALTPGSYSVRVLAPGFAPQRVAADLAQQDQLTIRLALAGREESVVVSATRTPLPREQTGAAEETLNSTTLSTMLPVSAGEALRFLPGAIVSDAGQRGGLSSLFVRGGDSRYNKVIVDGVPVNDPGGTFDFGVLSAAAFDRLEFVRGAESALYGSDAMTSVIQAWSATGHTRLPELTLGGDGGNYSSAHGFAALSGVRGGFDYNFFGDQFNTQGQSANDDYSESLAGANLGFAVSSAALLRLRLRHSSSRTGVPGEWNFNGIPFLTPDIDQRQRDHNFLASAEFMLAPSARWQQQFTGFEYNQNRLNLDAIADRDCVNFGIDCPFLNQSIFNRAGATYQGDFTPRGWARSTFGYQFEEETGHIRQNLSGDPADPGDHVHGLRRDHALFGQQFLAWKRISFTAGLRYENNESFGEKVLPHAALVLLVHDGGERVGSSRLRLAYGAGIKAPRFEESFGLGRFTLPNPALQPEENRSLEAGLEQSFFGGRYSLSADYFNNLFTNQIEFETVNPLTFTGQYVNLNRSLAHGSEVEFSARPARRISVLGSYVYTSTQILLAPLCTAANFCDPLLQAGQPLLRRPRQAGSLLVTYSAGRWNATLGGTFIGRRADSDFLFCDLVGCSVPRQNHTAGYARLDLGGSRRFNRHLTAYAKLENLLNKHYEDVSGYPAPRLNFRAGLEFRMGGE